MSGKLTVVQVKTLGVGRHGDGGGLWLRVEPSGRRSFEFRFMIAGKARWMFLGRFPDVSLAEAREKATEARKLAKAKVDPIEHAKAQRFADQRSAAQEAGGPTFGQSADAYIAQRAPTWSESNALNWRQHIRDYCEAIRGKPAERVTADDVFAIVDPLWIPRNDLAQRLRVKVERVLSFARSSDGQDLYFSREWVNPARWQDHLENRYGRPPKKSGNGHPHLPPEEVPAFVQRLRGMSSNSARLLELIILTALRSTEARLAEWSEFDFEKSVWTIPAERMKNGEEHTVPLTGRVLAILDEMRPWAAGSTFVFPGLKRGQPLSHGTLRAMMDGMKANASPHGFRASFKTWATDSGIRDDVSEACLAHVDPNRVRRAYQRSDLMIDRRAALEAWAAFIERGE